MGSRTSRHRREDVQAGSLQQQAQRAGRPLGRWGTVRRTSSERASEVRAEPELEATARQHAAEALDGTPSVAARASYAVALPQRRTCAGLTGAPPCVTIRCTYLSATSRGLPACGAEPLLCTRSLRTCSARRARRTWAKLCLRSGRAVGLRGHQGSRPAPERCTSARDFESSPSACCDQRRGLHAAPQAASRPLDAPQHGLFLVAFQGFVVAVAARHLGVI
jgi:hypothetical protein